MTEITCETQGHLWNSTGKCVMCGTPRPIEQLSSNLHNAPADLLRRIQLSIDGFARGESVSTWVNNELLKEAKAEIERLRHECERYFSDWAELSQDHGKKDREIEHLSALVHAKASLREGNYEEVKRLRDALGMISWSNDSAWQQQCAREALAGASVETTASRDAKIMELRGALSMLYDKWENGDPCYEDPEERRGYFGHAFNLTEQEENRVLALLPEGCPGQSPSKAKEGQS